jgi:hypothetical protein
MLLYGQTYLWEEDFSTNPGTWTLETNWSITSGYLLFTWSPTQTNYNLSATSPVITLPDNAGNLLVTQWVNYYSTYVDEAFEIAVLVDGTPNVLWTHDDGVDWGSDGGELLTLSLIPYQNQNVQLRFRSWGTSSYNINYWRIYHLAIEGSFDDDLQALSINGSQSPPANVPSEYTVEVRNNGVNTQNNYTVKLMKDGEVELATVAGTTIESGEIIAYDFIWTPTETGPTNLYGKVILTEDEVPENNETSPLNIIVMAAGTITVNVGSGTSSAYTLPLSFYNKNNLSQTIYMASELDIGGVISGIAYYNNFVDDLPDKDVKLWMAHTTQNDLSGGWYPPAEMQLVFDSTVSFPSGQNMILIPLDIPFAYDGVSNLVIMANRVWEDDNYSMTNHFYYTATTEFPNRSRNVQSNTVVYDPMNMTVTGLQTNRVPNTSFFLSVDGYGTLDGTVTAQATGNPLAEAEIEILGTGYTTTTNNSGSFVFPYVPEGIYDVRASVFGYNPLIIEDVEIEDAETTTINFSLNQLTNVTVSGQVVGSDYPTIGLEGSQVFLSGYEDYETTTGTNGLFSITGVYINQTYDMTILTEGYSHYYAQIEVEAADLDLGVIIVDEIAYPANSLVATQNANDTQVDLIWNSPLSIDYYFSDFETDDGDWEATASWDPVGDWEWTNTYNVNNWTNTGSAAATPPPNAVSGTGLWGTVINTNHTNSGGFSYLSQTFDFSGFSDNMMTFWSWNDSFGNFDYGQVSVNGNIVWGPAWNYTNTAWEEVVIDLSAYDGMSNVEIRFEHYATTVVNYAGWYIDDVYIGPESTLPARNKYAGSNLFMKDNPISYQSVSGNPFLTNQQLLNNQRVLENFVVYRFLNDDLDNEAMWDEIATVTDTTYSDLGWDNVPSGFYRFAVKAEYTNDVLSVPAISNWVGKDMTTNVTVNVTTDVGDSPAGASVTLYYQNQDPDGNSPTYIQTAIGDVPAIATFMNVLRGTYSIEVYKPGYTTYTQSNISIQTPTTLDVVLDEIPYPPVNLTYTAGNNLVNLNWQSPLPTSRDSGIIDYEDLYAELQASGITDKDEIARIVESIENKASITEKQQDRQDDHNRALLGYNVYRDGVQLNTNPIIDTTYNDTAVENNVTYIYYVTAVYTLAESVPSNSVTVVPGPNQVILIGEDTTTANTLPLNYFYKCSLSQTIYMADEINMAGVITQIRYFTNFTQELLNMPIQIWIGETTQDNLADGWISSNDLELVYDDTIDYQIGQDMITIQLDDFFFYSGSQNLVIMAKRVMDTQYYQSSNHFFYSVTPDYPNRSRNMQSDTNDYDTTNPTGGTLTNRVPNTGIYIVTVGMGTLDGYVYDQNNQPLQGAMVTVADTDFVAYSNSQGYYLFPFMYEGTHTVTASKFGYYDGVQEDVLVEEYETTSVNFNLNPLPTVSVSGRVVGSDQPDVGLDNAFISLDGYNYYESNGDDNGLFTIPGVYADHTYTMTVQRGGYSNLTQDVEVGNTDLDLEDVVVNELAFPPFDVTATLSNDNTEANIEWVSPDAYDFIDFRYDDGVPSVAIGLPDGTENSILGAIHQRTAILNSVSWYLTGSTNHPAVNVFVIGLNAQGLPNSNAVLYNQSDVTNNHNQWTIHELPEEINAPNGFLVGLSVAGNLGLAADNGTGEPYNFQNNTHYFTSNYTTGTWATLESAGYQNNFLIRAQGFDLGPARYSVQLTGTGSNDGMSSLLESEVIQHPVDFQSPQIPAQYKTNNYFTKDNNLRPSDRVLVGFIIYRLAEGTEDQPDLWDEIGTIPSTETTYTDTGLTYLINGNYRYAVRSVYTNNVISLPSLSNTIEYQEPIPFINNLQATVDGGNVHLSWQWADRNRADSHSSGSKMITQEHQLSEDKALLRNDSSLREFLGFKITRNGPVIAENLMDNYYDDLNLTTGTYLYTVIGVFTNGSTNMLHIEVDVEHSETEDQIVEPLITALRGNYPNPFNPETTISYSVSTEERVIIDVFNIRGQHVRTLVDTHQKPGNYSVVWNGKDESGKDAGSGIFFYRMVSGSYTSNRKMILLK